ncbi:DUF1343 domain-containing protein [Brevibacillus composti]|uniref:DUF1343 domain-containing protein n=1 Tax=Brevibacillus composti TaxID=2796470 RepID=A0A7T5EIA2_9BACL|nr:exo-beta-N-acetylmuramidase NamZ domain-containing protein [Brevibacillus composti]QQE73047.1 DUF1343 domain-containing protein [Brevibacillus composti]QUO40125.1 DUF1343 domain-containing protein [Brevibacillus composti]
MKRFIPFLILILIMTMIPPGGSSANTTAVLLGSDVLFSQFSDLIEGKKVGLLTNQTGVGSKGVSTIDALRRERNVQLTALFTPEHGLYGKIPAGEQVASFHHPVYGIPVYSLYGAVRKPTPEMLASVDMLLVDLQDSGAGRDTYLTTLYQCMSAAKEQGKPIVVLDRPNPLGGTIVEGPVLAPDFRSPVGVDTLPLAHGMTIGELARFFNRQLDAPLTVIPMKGYTRQMNYLDTGLAWIPSSPQFPDLAAVFGYMATGLGEGTPVTAQDHFRWIGGPGIDSGRYADLLNGALLPGVIFLPENKEGMGGVRLHITDPLRFNPARTGLYALAYAHQLHPFPVPKSGSSQSMFDLLMGTDKIGQYLEQGLSPQQIEQQYASDLAAFRKLREMHLIYSGEPYVPTQPLVAKHASPPPAPTASEQPGATDPAAAGQTSPAQSGQQGQAGQSSAPKAQQPAKDAGNSEPSDPSGKAAPADQQKPPVQPATPEQTGPIGNGKTADSAEPGQPPAPQPTAPNPSGSTPAAQAEAGSPAAPQAAAPTAPPPAGTGQSAKSGAGQPAQDKVAYLTFDDGPSPITGEILDILKQHQVKATFFVVGTSIPGHEDLLKRTISEGHEVGGHTYSHNYRTIYKDISAFFADLEKGNQLIERVTGIKPTVFRYPGGSTNTISKKYQNASVYNQKHTVMGAIKAEAAKRGYIFVDWNVTNGDARSSKYTPESALANIKAQVKNQKEIVILMHDAATKEATAKSLPAVIQFLKDHGYRFETIRADRPTVATVK